MSVLNCDSDGIVTLALVLPALPLGSAGAGCGARLREALALIEGAPDLRGVIVHLAASPAPAPDKTPRPDASVAMAQRWQDILALKNLMGRLENLPIPVVAALEGSALSGAYALALCCHRRIAVDDDAARIGFPEAQAGLLPGDGGTVRLLRLLGFERAIALLLEARTLSPAQAAAQGMIDALAADSETLLAQARTWIHGHQGFTQPWCDRRYPIPGGTQKNPALLQLIQQYPARLALQHRGAVPDTAIAILAAAAESLQVDLDAALLVEARYFLSAYTAA